MLHQLGGKAEPKELYPRMAKLFPQLTEEDLTRAIAEQPLDISMAQPRPMEPAKACREGRTGWFDSRRMEADAAGSRACKWLGDEPYGGAAVGEPGNSERPGLRE